MTTITYDNSHVTYVSWCVRACMKHYVQTYLVAVYNLAVNVGVHGRNSVQETLHLVFCDFCKHTLVRKIRHNITKLYDAFFVR